MSRVRFIPVVAEEEVDVEYPFRPRAVLSDRVSHLVEEILVHELEQQSEQAHVRQWDGPHVACQEVRARESAASSVSSATDNALDTTEMAILPVCLNDDVGLNDVRELRTLVSARRLRLAFEYAGIYDREAGKLEQWPSGPYIVACFLSLKDLVENFQYISVASLHLLARRHSVPVDSRALKASIIQSLCGHRCGRFCEPLNVLFRALRVDRRTSAKAEVVSVGAKVSETQNKKRRERERIAKGKQRADKDMTQRDKDIMERTQDASKSTESIRAPTTISRKDRDAIIKEWQTEMSPKALTQGVCAVCGYSLPESQLPWRWPGDIDLKLLQNNHLPSHVLPNNYAFELYERAILHASGLSNQNRVANIRSCSQCWTTLLGGKQPRNSLANFQYYGHCRLPDDIKLAFRNASPFDKMLVGRCRASRVTHFYSHKHRSGQPESTSQSYNRGNVAVVPQDSISLRKLLPPSRDEIRDTMCALFIGGKDKPTAETLKRIGPVLVTKSIVEKMINFFCENNPFFREAEVTFSQEHMDDLFVEGDKNNDVAVPRGVEITHLGDQEAVGLEGSAADYTQRADAITEDLTDLIMESVTYTSGDHATNRNVMKARALSWALSHNRFLVTRSGSSFVSDDDPGLLTYLWPWLDPFGIGGFHNPLRTAAQRISLEQQVRNLLRQADSPFQTDPTFAFICFNMLQKKEVNTNSCFR
ncbi:hypothetical protein BJ138DRAFT_1175181, partial [Hygrophoropsis aurantiaca]